MGKEEKTHVVSCGRPGGEAAHLAVEIHSAQFVPRAKDASVDVSLHSVPQGQHSFILGAGRVPEVDEAIEQMGRWVRSKRVSPPRRRPRTL